MKKYSKNILAIILIFSIFLLNSNIVFAANENIINMEEKSQVTATNSSSSGTLIAGGSLTLPLTLSSYVGLSKTLYINATCGSSSGELLLTLIDPNNDVAFSNLSMSPNEVMTKTYWLPVSGRWTLVIAAVGTSGTISVTAGWK